MSIINHIQNSVILGDFIGGNQYKYTVQKYESLFKRPIFLHYWGAKVSRLIFGNHIGNRSILDSTKVIMVLFDELIASLSDVVQSPFIYNNVFFHQLLSYQKDGNYLVSLTGTKTNQDLDLFLADREEFYAKPGFYKIASREAVVHFLDHIKTSSIPKRFDTGKLLEFQWKKTFESIENHTALDEWNNNIRNLVTANQDYFFSNQMDEFIRIPERLNGFPLVWDSVNYLKLIHFRFDTQSLENIERYLASEWINCYLTNYHANIPNALIGIEDCTLGLKNVVDFLSILKFLSHYRLLNLIMDLDFEELMELKFSYSVFYLKKVMDDCMNGVFILKDPAKLEKRIARVCTSSKKSYEKITIIIDDLCIERR